jgi:hypothetical protein
MNNNDRWVRLLLAFNIVALIPLAIWPLVSPKGFYDNFPGGSYHWIDINGPYNEHFLRDFGALNAALLVVALYAFWKLTPSLVQAAGLALAIYALPHAIYHLNHLDVYKSSEKVIAVAPLVLQFFSGVAIALLPSRSSRGRTPARDRTS